MVSYFFLQTLAKYGKINFGIFQKFAMISLDVNNLRSTRIRESRLAVDVRSFVGVVELERAGYICIFSCSIIWIFYVNLNKNLDFRPENVLFYSLIGNNFPYNGKRHCRTVFRGFVFEKLNSALLSLVWPDEAKGDTTVRSLCPHFCF